MADWGHDRSPVSTIPATVAQDGDFVNDGQDFLGVRCVAAFPQGFTFKLLVRLRGRPFSPAAFRFGIPESGPGDLFIHGEATDSKGTQIRVAISSSEGGSGGYYDEQDFCGTGYANTFWVPLPEPATAFELVADWPDIGLHDRHLHLDLDMIRAAGRRAVVLAERR